MTDAYRALALQFPVEAINQRDDPRAAIDESIDRLADTVGAAAAWIGPDLRLVVCPEYFLTGFPLGETFAEWIERGCLAPDGPEYRALGKIASRHHLYLAGNAYETDPHFPQLYFQTCYVIDPAGSVLLRYRRLNSMFAPTPHDVWDKYLEIYGWDGVFPVASTDIGNLACVASEEILYPEIARALAVRGAEVICHPTAEPGGRPDRPKEIAKRARAFENLAYIVSANTGGVSGTAVPAASTNGGSKIVDYEGRVLTEAGYGSDMSAFAEIDLEALRRHRRWPSMDNVLARQRFEILADTYRRSIYPPGTMSNGEVDRGHFKRTLAATIERMVVEGIIR